MSRSTVLTTEPGNTKGGSITVQLTSCLTGFQSAVWQLTIFVFICKSDISKPVKQEVNGTVLPPLLFLNEPSLSASVPWKKFDDIDTLSSQRPINWIIFGWVSQRINKSRLWVIAAISSSSNILPESEKKMTGFFAFLQSARIGFFEGRNNVQNNDTLYKDTQDNSSKRQSLKWYWAFNITILSKMIRSILSQDKGHNYIES